MTALVAPASPVPPPAEPSAGRVSDVVSTFQGWVRALPRPADLAAVAGTAGEWLGYAALDPAWVVLGREPAEDPTADDDVLGDRPTFARIYAAVGAVQAGATSLVTGVLGAGRWAPLVGVIGAFGLDSLLTTATCVRAVSHVGTRYGFAVRSDAERTAVLAIVATTLGASTTDGDHRDHRHLAALVVMRLSMHRAPTELVRFVPAVGPVVDAALGAVLGARLLARVVDDAERHYRARYLTERAVVAA